MTKSELSVTISETEKIELVKEISEKLTRIPAAHTREQRIEFWSNEFLGRPYLLGSLGEGSDGRYDNDPLFRFDAFDCTTFVETVMALSLSRDFEEFKINMAKIRYKNSEIDFLKRNHFTSLDWIPNNLSNGLLLDMTSKVAGSAAKVSMAKASIDKGGWLLKLKPSMIERRDLDEHEKDVLIHELQGRAKEFPPVNSTLDYLSFVNFSARTLKKIPNGAIISVVRPNWNLRDKIGTNLNVSHQGFAIRRKGLLFFRHASNGSEKKVRDVNFVEYFKRQAKTPSIKGINILQLN